MKRLALTVAPLALFGCDLLGGNRLAVDYALDAEEFKQSFGDVAAPFPRLACDPAASADPCATLAAQALPAGAITGASFSCDASSRACTGQFELRKVTTINLAQQSSFPPDVVRYGASAVSLEKIAYWMASNTSTVPIPPIDLYVGPKTAQSEQDATLLATIGAIPAGSVQCTDPRDPMASPEGGVVCDVPFVEGGRVMLESLARDYTQPFTVIAHTVVKFHAGDAVPAGTIDFFVRPTLSFGFQK